MAAPTGNDFWTKRRTHGKPKAWDSVDAMVEAITTYFDECKNATAEVATPNGAVTISKPEIPTIEGIGAVLGLCRDALLNYQKEPGYEDYYDTIKDAKAHVQEKKAAAMINGRGSTAGLIFDLKNNHGYVDKTVQDNNVALKGKPAWLNTFSDESTPES